MNQREKTLALRSAIELIVKFTKNVTSKYLAGLFKLTVSCINRTIIDMDNIHRQDIYLYYGERL